MPTPDMRAWWTLVHEIDKALSQSHLGAGAAAGAVGDGVTETNRMPC